MRKYIVIALLLLVVGIAASLYLIPTTKEVAGLQAQDATAVDLGKVDVESEYNQGRRTWPIVNALVDKRIAAGDKAGATKILEDYVTANATDVNGRKKLAEQYREAGNQAGYNQQIEAIAAAAPTEENLRMLSDLYNSSKEYAKQAVVLQQILDVTKGEKPEAFVDLATIQVVLGDSDGALKTVEGLKAKHPTFSSYPMTRIMVSVLADKGQVDRAFDVAKQWVDSPVAAPVPSPTAPVAGAAPAPAATPADPRPKELADLSNILLYSGHADKAVALVEPHKDILPREPELVLAYVNANVAAGRSDEAFAVLKQFDEAGTMTAALYPPYLDLALKREDVPAAETIANKLDVATFTEEMALNTIEVARANAAPSVVGILATRFGQPTNLQDKPVLAAVIAILTNDKTQDTKIETALNTQLTSTQRIRLAESCARAKKTACFDAIVKQYPPMEQMSPTQVAEYAQLFIIAERPADLVEPVGKLANAEHSPVIIQTAYYRLAAAAGNEAVLKPWLEANAKSVPVSQLQELFYLANDRHHGEVASDIAERLYARDPSPMNRDIMVSAYLGAGAYDKALPLVREQMKEPGANDGLYLSTLSKVAKKDTSARKELTDYALISLNNKRGDARQQLNYAYILINNGRKAEVIPYAKANAAEHGGEWKKMYAQLTQKPGVGGAAVKLTREQMIAMSNSKTISAANKHQVAFNLLNAGYKDDAMLVFKDLAKDKGPDSQEVKDLMYMWGGKLNQEQLAWVQQRAATANAYDKNRWADIINNTADDASVLNYVSATPDALYNRDLRKKYFRILAATGSRQNYDASMRNWVAQTTDVPALLDYASIGQGNNYREAAINGYGRVLALDPNNAKALSEKATLDFGKGKYAEADKNLNQYLANKQQSPAADDTDPAQAHFYKAQLLRRDGNKAGAAAEFQQVVILTMQSGASAPDALSRLYTSQFHLGQHDQAKAGFEQLLSQFPDDKGVLADYMSVLIEYKYLDDATRIANQYDKNSPYYRKGAALVGRSATTASVQQLSAGREIKINFSQPIEGKAPIDVSKAQKLAWLEHSEVGYDSVTVSAKPGYVVRYIPTANEQFEVVAAPAQDYAPQVEAQRQQDLRLQLLYARIEQESGQTEKAQQRLAALKYYYPADPQLLSYEASVAQAQGNNEQAIALVKQAQTIAPENEELAYMAREFSRPTTGGYGATSPQFVKADVEYRNYGSPEEVITTLSGQVRLPGRNEMGASWQHDFITPEGIADPATGLATHKNANRDQGELFLAHYLENGGRLQGSLFGDNNTAGGGAYYAFSNGLGRTELIGEYHKPYWDYAQAVYANANRDRVGARHYATITPRTSLGLEASVNNYNIRLDDDQVQTILARASLNYALQQQTENQPYWGIGYGFDGEYKTGDHDTRPDAFGSSYHPFDWRSREVHYFSVTYRDDWTPTTHVLLNGGYAFDRLNDSGPAVEGRLTQDITDRWELGLRARYGLVTTGGASGEDNNDAVNLGGDLMYKF